MKPKMMLLSMIALALLSAGCAKAPVAEVPKGPSAAEDSAAIRALILDNYVKAYNAADVNGILAVMAPEFIWMPPEEPAVTSREALAAWLEKQFNGFKESGATIQYSASVAGSAVSGDWAYLHLNYVFRSTPKKAGKPAEFKGKALVVCQRQPDGSWKAARAYWNRDEPPPRS
jgi:ketosteroid isomerase-like protein